MLSVDSTDPSKERVTQWVYNGLDATSGGSIVVPQKAAGPLAELELAGRDTDVFTRLDDPTGVALMG